jgi:hypothetical protein
MARADWPEESRAASREGALAFIEQGDRPRFLVQVEGTGPWTLIFADLPWLPTRQVDEAMAIETTARSDIANDLDCSADAFDVEVASVEEST